MFYVYEHWRPDLDLPFYVGKGKGKRAWKGFAGRSQENRRYGAVLRRLTEAGLKIEVKIVEGDLAEDVAFVLEIAEIASWRAAGVDLVNLTNGGDGASGHVHSEETRRKIAIAAANISPEGRLKRSQSMTGIKRSDETREKISVSKINPPTETRERNSLATQRSWADPHWRARQIEKRSNPSDDRRKILSEAAKLRCARDGTFGAGSIWITDGTHNRRVLSSEPILEGWRQGVVQKRDPLLIPPRTGRGWITDGVNNRVLQIDEEVPDDWRRGCTQHRRKPGRWEKLRLAA